ncbi:hypothetical protein PXK01_04620 [Phaeobacter sp. PT47_59]|uniref:hypothetical protein n=1 Tax=Phaeobacter sp. PT47_59 TaxID=3029979 RepID=UPI00237FE12F|nr:hypothetical protein [Phaeobacter sp. PT47_59]MDE4173427.1 hypothetical protein [Phaeobacter sp. PT47_59]
MSGAGIAGIGHNNGPSMEAGRVWRIHAWKKAQKKLMPNTIPKLVLQMRIRRAAELGMDYKTYARVRQTSGQDITGLLFSSNALRIISYGAHMPEAERRALEMVRNSSKLALVHRPNSPEAVLAAHPVLDAAGPAPRFNESWSEMRARVQDLIKSQGLPGSSVVVIGDAPLESEWSTAARAAAYLSAAEYFRHPAI